MGDKAPCYSFLSIAGLDLERQPTFKCFLQQLCCLQSFLVVRQEGTKIPPFVRLSWARVPSLRTGIRHFKQWLECCASEGISKVLSSLKPTLVTMGPTG